MSLTNAQYSSPETVENFIVEQGGKIINRYQAKLTNGLFRTQYTVEFTSAVDSRIRRAILAPSSNRDQPFYWVLMPA